MRERDQQRILEIPELQTELPRIELAKQKILQIIKIIKDRYQSNSSQNLISFEPEQNSPLILDNSLNKSIDLNANSINLDRKSDQKITLGQNLISFGIPQSVKSILIILENFETLDGAQEIKEFLEVLSEQVTSFLNDLKEQNLRQKSQIVVQDIQFWVAIKNNLNKISKEIPEENLESFLNKYLNGENSILSLISKNLLQWFAETENNETKKPTVTVAKMKINWNLVEVFQESDLDKIQRTKMIENFACNLLKMVEKNGDQVKEIISSLSAIYSLIISSKTEYGNDIYENFEMKKLKKTLLNTFLELGKRSS